MPGLRTPPNDSRGYGRVLLQEFTEFNDVTPTSVLNTNRPTGSVSIRASDDNNSEVYVGFDNDLTTNNGFPLLPGDAIGIELDLRTQEIFVIATSDADEVRYITTN